MTEASPVTLHVALDNAACLIHEAYERTGDDTLAVAWSYLQRAKTVANIVAPVDQAADAAGKGE